MNDPNRAQKRTRLRQKTTALVQTAASFRPFGVPDTESIMQFAHLGALTCLCNGRHSVHMDADRREVCRTCGCQAAPCAGDLFDREASPAEIHALTESIRMAGVRARGMEIPATIQSVAELHRYLDEYQGKKGRKPPRRPNAPVALARIVAR